MSMAVNAVYNRMQIQHASIQKPKSKGSDFTQAVKGAVDSYRFCGVSEFHPTKDCATDEIYFGYAIAGEPGNDTELPCNFYKPVDYNEEDPVIIARMYPWDGSEAIVREIHIKDVNLSSADYYDTFAYGIYLKEKGEMPYLNDLLTAYDMAYDDSSSENDGMLDMSLFPINSYEKKNEHNWYSSSAISAASASMIGKPFSVEMTSSMTIAPSAGAGKMLGASSIATGSNTQQTMIARYSENSTEQNPVVTVSLGDFGSFDISVKDVDPQNANQLEMFALCSYMDDKNLTCPGSNGFYNRLKNYIQTAIDLDELPDINSHFNAQKKINWTKGLDIVMKNDVTNEYTYKERSEQVKLRGFFEKQHKEIEIRRMDISPFI